MEWDWLFGSFSSADEPHLPPEPLPSELLLPLQCAGESSNTKYASQELIDDFPGSGICALCQPSDDLLLVGSEDGRLFLYQFSGGCSSGGLSGAVAVLTATASVADASAAAAAAYPNLTAAHWLPDNDEQSTFGRHSSAIPVAALAPPPRGGSAAFALCGGMLFAAPLPSLEPLAALGVGPVLAFCVRAPLGDGGLGGGGEAVLCVATAGALLLCTHSGCDGPGRFSLHSQAALPDGCTPRTVCWAASDMVVVADTLSRFHIVERASWRHPHNAYVEATADGHATGGGPRFLMGPAVSRSRGEASGGSGMPLPRRDRDGGAGKDHRREADGRRRVGGGGTEESRADVAVLPMALGEVLLLSGGVAAAAIAVDAASGRRTRELARLPAFGGRGVGGENGGPGCCSGASLGWPLLLLPSGSDLLVMDLLSAVVTQTLSFPTSRAGVQPPRLVPLARSRLSALVAQGSKVFVVAGTGSGAEVERSWLSHAAERPWDALLVDKRVSEALDAPAHPLSRSVEQLSRAFEAACKSGFGFGGGAREDGSGGGSRNDMPGSSAVAALPHDSSLCRAACDAAVRHAARLQTEALLLFPALAPRTPRERAHGAAGAELLKVVERAAYGVMYDRLVGFFAQARASEQARYSQQVRLLSQRLRPCHLRLPPDTCAAAESTSPPLAEAVSRLKALPQACTPTDFLDALVETCRLISSALTSAGAPPPSADELMPLVAYVLLAAATPRLPARLAIASAIASDGALFGEGGYSLATFQVACTWTLELRWDTINPSSGNGQSSGELPHPASSSRRPPSTATRLSDAKPRCATRRSSSISIAFATPAAAGSASASSPPFVGEGMHTASLASESISRSMELLRSLEAELEAGKERKQPSLVSEDTGGEDIGSGWAANGDESTSSGGKGHAAGLVQLPAASQLASLSLRELLMLSRSVGVDVSACVDIADVLELLRPLAAASVQQGHAGPSGSNERRTADAPPAWTDVTPASCLPQLGSSSESDRLGQGGAGASDGHDGAVRGSASSRRAQFASSQPPTPPANESASRPQGSPSEDVSGHMQMPRMGAIRERRERMRDSASTLKVGNGLPPAAVNETNARVSASSTSPVSWTPKG